MHVSLQTLINSTLMWRKYLIPYEFSNRYWQFIQLSQKECDKWLPLIIIIRLVSYQKVFISWLPSLRIYGMILSNAFKRIRWGKLYTFTIFMNIDTPCTWTQLIIIIFNQSWEPSPREINKHKNYKYFVYNWTL